MKKTKLLLVLSALTLAGCDFISITNTNKIDNNVLDNPTSENTQNSQNNTGNPGEIEDNNSTNTGTNTGTNTNTNTNEDDHDTNTNPVADVIPDNETYALSDYTDFAFHEGREPIYHDDWSFYYGTSLNPNGRLWENPNEKSEASGIEFVKNTYFVSPLFDSWTKVEVRFNFWFSSHTSNSYKATDGKPQFILEAYNLEGTKLSSKEISIQKSDIPNNNTTKWFTSYINEPSMRFFILRWNNYIANGNSGYSAIICDAKLKGWPYN